MSKRKIWKKRESTRAQIYDETTVMPAQDEMHS